MNFKFTGKIFLFILILLLGAGCFKKSSTGSNDENIVEEDKSLTRIIKVNPYNIEKISGDTGVPVKIFDRNISTGVTFTGDSAFKLLYNNQRKLKTVKVYGSSSCILKVYREGETSPLLEKDLSECTADSWNSFTPAEEYEVENLVAEFTAQSTGESADSTVVKEIEFWFEDDCTTYSLDNSASIAVARSSKSINDLKDSITLTESNGFVSEFYNADTVSIKDESLSIVSDTDTTAEAKITFDIDYNPSLYNRAVLTYKAKGFYAFFNVGREINGRGRREAVTADYEKFDSEQWYEITEEIDPALLNQGENILTIYSDDNVKIKEMNLALLQENGLTAMASISDSRAFDLDTGTYYTMKDTSDSLTVEFEKESDVDYVLINTDENFNMDNVTFEYVGDSGWEAFTVTASDDIKAGWNRFKVNENIATSSVRLCFGGTSSSKTVVINEVRFSASPVVYTEAPELTVTYPLNGEYFSSQAVVCGFIKNLDSTVTVYSANESSKVINDDGSFAIKENRGENIDTTVAAKDMTGYVSSYVKYTKNMNSNDDGSGTGDGNSENSDSGSDSETVSSADKFETLVYADSDQSITYRGVTLDIPAGAVSKTTKFTIIPLYSGDINNLNYGMKNVTYPAAGYRFLPSGTFEKYITVRFQYDPTVLSSGQKDEDVYMYYYNTEATLWQKLDRVGVDKNNTEVVSKTNHFTDIINATLTVPDHPDPLTYNPNSIKDIKAANPASKVNLAEVSPAGNRGDLSANYPIEIPAGRKGVQPNIAISYNSGGGYGWLGQGWDLSVDSISIDTRWGVPRYDGNEIFLLNGSRLEKTGSDSTGDIYRPQIEGSFSRIRKITESDSVYWEITDKQGTKYYYGLSDGSKLVSNRTIKGVSGYPVFRWYLERVADTNGNSIIYEYESDRVDGLVVDKYLSKIYYTGVNSTKGKYVVEFIKDDGSIKSGVSFSYRSGFKIMSRKLLKTINVKYSSALVRSYELTYMQGKLNKTLLKSIKQYGSDGREFAGNVHEFEYYDDVADGYSFGEETNISGNYYKSDSLFGIDFDYGALSSSEGKTTSVNCFFGFAPWNYSKEGSFGFAWGKSVSKQETSLQVMDINGDGLPDQVYIKGGAKCRPGVKNEDGTISFGDEQSIVDFPESNLGSNESKTTTKGAQIHVSPWGAGISATYDKVKGEVKGKTYFSDVNGDGLVDFVSSRRVYFNISSKSGEIKFTNGVTDVAFLGEVDLDESEFTVSPRKEILEERFLDDPMRLWKAPYNGKIKVTGAVKIPGDIIALKAAYDADKNDGLIASILHYGYSSEKYTEIWKDELDSSDENKEKSITETFDVRAGDFVCFRVNSMYDGANDTVEWAPKIEYTEYHEYSIDPYSTLEYQSVNINTDDFYTSLKFDDMPFDSDENPLDENGRVIFNYDARTDFSSAGADLVNSVSYDCSDGGNLNISGTFTKSEVTSDDVCIYIEVLKQETTESGDIEYVTVNDQSYSFAFDETVSGYEFSFDAGELTTSNSVRISLLSDSPVDISAMELSANLNYSYYPRDEDGTKLDKTEVSEPALVRQHAYRQVKKDDEWYDNDYIEQPYIFSKTLTEDDEIVNRTVKFGVTLAINSYTYSEPHQWRYYRMSDINSTDSQGDEKNIYDELGVTLVIKKWDENLKRAVEVDKVKGIIKNKDFDLIYGDAGENADEEYHSEARVIFNKDVMFENGAKYYFIYVFDQSVLSKYVNIIDPSFANKDSNGDYIYNPYNGQAPDDYLSIDDGTKIYRVQSSSGTSGGYRNWYYSRNLGDDSELYEGDGDVEGYRNLSSSDDTPMIEDDALEDMANSAKNFSSDDEDAANAQSENIKKFSGMGFYDSLAERMKKSDSDALTDEELDAKYKSYEFKAWTGIGNDCWISSDRMSSTRIIEYFVAKTDAEIESAYTGTDEIEIIAGVCNRGVIRNTSSSSTAKGLGAGVGPAGISGTKSTGSAVCEKDLFDFNGDGFPDVITRGRVQFTNYLGELDEHSSAVGGFNYVRENSDENYNFSASAISGISQTDRKSDSSSNGTSSIAPTAGLSANRSSGKNNLEADFIDVNGDGLPDRVYGSGDKVYVRYNTGYELLEGEVFDSNTGNFRKSTNGSFGGGASAGFVISELVSKISGETYEKAAYGGGPSLGTSQSSGSCDYVDVNGDGLKDKVYSGVYYTTGQGLISDESGLTVYLNTGKGFSTEAVTYRGGYGELNKSSNMKMGVSAYASVKYPIILPFIGFIGTFILNPGAGYTKDYGSGGITMMDMNGDGYLDQVKSTGTRIRVCYNQVGRTNLLKKVTRPLGSEIETEYERAGNTVKMGQGKWVVKTITVKDGSGSTADGHILTTEYKYTDGEYDRTRRQFTGFGTVAAKSADDTYSITKYYTDYYYQGLQKEMAVKVMDGNLDLDDEEDLTKILTTTGNIEGKIYSRVYNEYGQEDKIDANSKVKFTYLWRKTTTQYEGTTDQKITKEEEYKYDDYGNVIVYNDRGDTTTVTDDVTAKISYKEATGISDSYQVSLPLAIYVYEGELNGTLLRKRTATYDSKGNLVELNVWNGSKTIETGILYDSYGNMRTLVGPTDNNGQRYIINYSYDDQVNTYVVQTKDSFGYISKALYDYKWGAPTRTIDINKNVMTYRYDTKGRLDSVYGPYDQNSSDPTLDFIYYTDRYPAEAVTHNKESSDSVRNLDTVIYVDGLQRVLQTKKTAEIDGSLAMVASGAIDYDKMGRVKKQGQPVQVPHSYSYTASTMKNAATMHYDKLGRNVRTELADGTEVQADYSIEGNLYRTRTEDQEGNYKAVYKNVDGLIKKVTEYDGSQDINTTYQYDSLNQITGVTDAKGNTTTVTYDKLGRRTAVENPDTGLVEYVYDNAGQLVRKITPNTKKIGKYIEYVYKLNRLYRIIYPEGNNVVYTYGDPGATYNRAGRIYKIENDQSKEEYRYGKMGEVIQKDLYINQTIPKTETKQYTMEYSFDNFGRMQAMTYPDGETVRYYYGNGGLLKSVRGSKDGEVTTYVKDIIYDVFEQRTKMEMGNGVINEYTYDDTTRRLSHLKSYKGDKVYQNISYEFDKVGNILERVNKDFVTTGTVKKTSTQTYSYDNLYRLTGSTGEYTKESWLPYFSNRTNTYTNSVSYNSIGNITRKSMENKGTYPELGNEVRTLTDTSYDRDYSYTGAQPHAVTKAGELNMTYDANGNMLTKEWSDKSVKLELTWDSENRMLASESINESTGAKVKTTYKYGPDGRRVLKTGPYGEAVYVDANYTVRNGTVVGKHIFAGSQRIVSKVTDTSGDKTDTGTFYQSTDHLGSTNILTDANGDFYEHVESFADGGVWVKEGTDNNNLPFSFTSHEKDPETGLFYAQARYYDSQLSSFISADDRIDNAFTHKGLNIYSYCHHNPVNYIDPDGHEKLGGNENGVYNYEGSGSGGGVHSSGGSAGGSVSASNTGSPSSESVPNQPLSLLKASSNFDFGADFRQSSSENLQKGNYGMAALRSTQGACETLYDGALAFTGAKYIASGIGSLLARIGAAIGGGGAAVKQEIVSIEGQVSLGHYPDYVKLAERIGAKKFSIPDNIWNKMTSVEQWAANKKFLDRLILRGDDVHLATSIDKIRPGSFYEKEIEYLLKNGYNFIDNMTKMVKGR